MTEMGFRSMTYDIQSYYFVYNIILHIILVIVMLYYDFLRHTEL